MILYPLKFKPRFKERIWGGTLLADKLGKKLPRDMRIGESWELSGVPGDLSVVASGALAGNNIEELTEVYMGDLVGEKIYEKYGLTLPLLFKLIDAQDDLSIQVHPWDELAAERHNSFGKTEMWYVVDCEPGAFLYVGFNGEVSREQYLEAVEKGNLPSLLRKVEVRPGSAFFIPAGVIHAIGKGCLIAEIQQTSDITYRVDDWGRVDDKGNPRELHTELAVDSITYGKGENCEITAETGKNKAVTLKKCSYFTTNLIEVDGTMEREYAGLDSFVVYMMLDGGLSVDCEGKTTDMSKGDTVMIPAAFDSATLTGRGRLLEVYID